MSAVVYSDEEKPGTVFNVLTRTCNRPHRYKRCRESVKAQETSLNVKQFVSIDRPCTYVEAEVLVPATGRIAPEIPTKHAKHRDATYNLYINDMLAAVKEGWVFVLDDDDEFLTRDALKKLEPYLTDPDKLVVFKFAMGFEDGKKRFAMPNAFGRELVINDVPCSCYVYHSKHKELGLWHGKYSGDFFAAENLAKNLNIVWVDEVIAGTQVGASEGKQANALPAKWKPRPMKTDKKEPFLSIIIPVHNQAEWTASILDQIAKTVHMRHEVIVVDNGSTDETKSILNGARVIKNKHNTGVYHAWNQGCKAAIGTHLALLNNDLLLPDGWAEKLIAHGRDAICPSYDQSPKERQDFESYNNKLSPGLKDASRPGVHPQGFAGFCYILTREVYDRVGKFDESYLYWFGDNDYFIRLNQMGIVPVMAQDVFIHHYANKTCNSLADFVPQREKERKIFVTRWPDAV
jgi:GT2 family glycosyltransferase